MRWLRVPSGLTDVAMYCRKAKLRLPLKFILEEYKCDKARLLSMLEDSEDPVVKTVQLTIKTGRQTTEHVLSSCKITFSQGRYTWRQSYAQLKERLPNALIFTTEAGAKLWHGSFHTTTDHDGVNSSIQKQNGRGPHPQKKEIPEPENAGYKAVVSTLRLVPDDSQGHQSTIF
ncbi:hypothetical protein RRG08_041156 [Elysia crispata]|uniref:Uncharacterized protein n=1 Tax=Elysia crispata TaxID=231223 RepID=A0AAE0XXS7_9GAST|nr:hypothetical protein RRG08_041156 [Elysia crispata]